MWICKAFAFGQSRPGEGSAPVTGAMTVSYRSPTMTEKREERDWNPWRPPSREKLIDRQIREAQEAGTFDDLPFQGEPLPLVDDSAAGDWALAYRMLKGARMAPPWIETDKEIRALIGERDAIVERAPRSSAIGRRRDRDELRRVVDAANRAITRLNHEAPTYRQHRRLLDLEFEIEALARAHDPEP
jgi:hypothetical protein